MSEKDLLGQKGSESQDRDEKDERDRTNQATEDLRAAIRRKGGKPRAFTRIQLRGLMYCLLRTQFLPSTAYQLAEVLERPRAWWGRQDKLMVSSYWGIIAPLLLAASLLAAPADDDDCKPKPGLGRRDCLTSIVQ